MLDMFVLDICVRYVVRYVCLVCLKEAILNVNPSFFSA